MPLSVCNSLQSCINMLHYLSGRQVFTPNTAPNIGADYEVSDDAETRGGFNSRLPRQPKG